MTNADQYVRPGDPLKIGAGTWNDLLDLADLAREADPTGGTGLGHASRWGPRCVVEAYRAQTATGVIPSRGPVVLQLPAAPSWITKDVLAVNRDPHPRGLIIPAIHPHDPEAGTDAQIAASAAGVALTAIGPGETGPVAVAGICLAAVTINDLAHRFARLVGSGVGGIWSDDSGPVRILFSAGALGTQFVPVLLNAPSGDAIPTPPGIFRAMADAPTSVTGFRQGYTAGVGFGDVGPAVVLRIISTLPARRPFVNGGGYLGVYVQTTATSGEFWCETGLV